MPPRLAQILELLLAGESPKAIARRVGLSLWTVREHVQRLYRRLGVSGRDELMARFVAGPPQQPPAA
jgi:DNA-binding CsgD family transcriptional regulator